MLPLEDVMAHIIGITIINKLLPQNNWVQPAGIENATVSCKMLPVWIQTVKLWEDIQQDWKFLLKQDHTQENHETVQGLLVQMNRMGLHNLRIIFRFLLVQHLVTSLPC